MTKRILLFLLLLLLVSCVTNPVTGKKELMLISESQEISIGASAVPAVEYEYGRAYPEAQINEYVNTVGQNLVRVSHRPKLAFHFKALNSSVVNAFALPGGFIYITRGLLVKLTNEAQLAAVLGHEIGHVTARHGAKHLQSALGFQFLVKLALSLDAARHKQGQASKTLRATAQVGSALFGVISLGYGREHEYEADELGLTYAYRAGYHPLAMVQLLQIIQQMEKGGGGGPEFLSTHPKTQKRIDEVDQEIRARYPDTTQPGAPFQYGAESFQTHTQPIKQAQQVYLIADQAQVALKAGKTQEALALYDQAITQLPGHADLYTRRGLIYLNQPELGKAASDFTRAQELDPASYDARVGLGRVHLINRQYSQAQPGLQKAIQLLPTHPAAHLYLGETYLAQHNLAGASEEFNTVLEVAPSDSPYARQAQQRIDEMRGKK